LRELKILKLEDKINRIENWRGVLAILVLFSHSIQLLCSPKMSQHWMISLGPIAHISVLIFFFLSGVVIFSSLEKRFKSQDKLIFIFYKYIRSRFIRIYPPLIGMIIIIIILKIYIKSTFPKLPNEFMFSFNDIINYLFMKDVSLGKINAPLWTLIIEWWLYIIGFISYFILTNKPVYKIIGVLILSILFFGMISKINNNFFVYFTNQTGEV
jgi:peptidoglycan/LPS O-acetylase OafA/YrhL